MKKVFFTLLAVAGIALAATAQENKTMYIMKKGVVTYTVPVSDIDSIIFYKPAAGVEINSVIWAICNVDAPGTFAAKPEDAGMFYQWNCKIGWSADNPMINSNGDTMWNFSFPTGTLWEKDNDPSPAGWHVPTSAEIQKLLDTEKVSNVWTTENNVYGRKFTDITSRNSIFLPAVGHRYSHDGSLGHVGSLGSYWSSSQSESSSFVYGLVFSNIKEADCTIFGGYNGFSVRSVADKN